jgi:hypothetical protein
MGIKLQLLVIGDDDLPEEHRWAIIRPRNSEPVLAVKEQWSRDIRTLTDALASLPCLTADHVRLEGVQRLSMLLRAPSLVTVRRADC